MAFLAFLAKELIHLCILVALRLIQPRMLVVNESTDGLISMSVCIFHPIFLWAFSHASIGRF